jgi:hypothetical protein
MRLRDALWMVVGTALVVALAVADALAVPNTYNTLGAFQTAAGTIILSIDEFDGIGFTDFEISIDRGPYSVSVLPADVGFGLGSQTESDFCEGGAIAGEGCLVVTMNPNGLTFTFDSPINAFGFAFIQANASDIPSVTLNGNLITGSYTPQLPDHEIGFFGLIDTVSFTTVVLSGVSAGKQFGLDTLRYGAGTPATSVPEPSTLALLLGGVPGMWAAVRYARRSRT